MIKKPKLRFLKNSSVRGHALILVHGTLGRCEVSTPPSLGADDIQSILEKCPLGTIAVNFPSVDKPKETDSLLSFRIQELILYFENSGVFIERISLDLSSIRWLEKCQLWLCSQAGKPSLESICDGENISRDKWDFMDFSIFVLYYLTPIYVAIYSNG